MKKLLNFLLVVIIALTFVACDYITDGDSDSTSQSQSEDLKQYSISIVYRESALGVEKSESGSFSLKVGQKKDYEIPEIADDGTENALICWVVNGVEAEESVGISTISVERTKSGATVTVGSTTIELSQNDTLISLTTKYPVVDVYDLSFAYKTNASAELSTQSSTVQLGIGQMSTITLPVIDLENNDTFEGWVINGQLAENSKNATTATISRSESGLKVVIGDSTLDFDASVIRFEFATKYGQAVVTPPESPITYKITIKYKENEFGDNKTDERTVSLEIGQSRKISLPTSITEEVRCWKVNGREASSSAKAVEFTIERTQNGVKVVLGGSTFEFDNNTAIEIKNELVQNWTDNY